MPSAPHRRVLVVDDNADVLCATSELLHLEGYSVVTAQNGADALGKMKMDDSIAVVLLDLWMPEMDGWEFLRRKKSEPNIADVPVIVVSGVPPLAIDGAELTLRKPVNPEFLMTAIKRCVSSPVSSPAS
jgi:CheY-like chemotaxis protein